MGQGDGQSDCQWWLEQGHVMERDFHGVAIKSGPGGFQKLGLGDRSRWARGDWGRRGDDFRQREQGVPDP